MERPANTSISARILVVSAYAGNGASGQHAAVCKTVDLLAEAGGSVEHVVLPALVRGEGAIVGRLQFGATLAFEMVRRFLVCAIGRRPDMVVAAIGQSGVSLCREGLFSTLVRFRFRSPLVVVLHSSYAIGWTGGLVKSSFFWLLSTAKRIVVLGPKMAGFLAQNLGRGMEQSLISMVDNQGEVPLLTAEAVKQKQKPGGIITVLYFAALFPSKGYLDLLAALRLCRTEVHNRMRVLLVGDLTTNHVDANHGSLASRKTELERELTELNDTGVKLEWLSGRTTSDAEALFANAHIFVLPSYSEGQPLGMINALSSGCATILTRVGEISSVVGEQCGAVIEPGDRSALGDALDRLVLDDELRLKSAMAGLEIARSRFTKERIQAAWIGIVREVASNAD